MQDKLAVSMRGSVLFFGDIKILDVAVLRSETVGVSLFGAVSDSSPCGGVHQFKLVFQDGSSRTFIANVLEKTQYKLHLVKVHVVEEVAV